MRILSRYVLREFGVYLAPSVVGFVAIFLVVDLAGRLSSFIDRGLTPGTIALYYLYYIPYISVLVLPMAMLLACLFCMGGLARHQELTAMKAAGASLYRIVLPIQVLALVISACAFLVADRLMPEGNRRRSALDSGEMYEQLPEIIRQVVLPEEGDRIVYVAAYFPRERRGEGVTLDQYEGLQPVSRILAEEIVWRQEGWDFLRGSVRYFGDADLEHVSAFESMRLDDFSFGPGDLAGASRPEEQMTGAELRAFIARKIRTGRDADRETVELHLRMAFPFASFVIVLLGVPISGGTRSAGKPLLVGMCLLLSFVYYGSIQAGRAFGWNGLLPPFFGAWGANLIFLAVGVVLLFRTRK
ncbi:MAG: LptF/LptG family permease [Candidatus Latescibacteria bacterium]|nr:LptF/LptG family permease [Candidatus Latescibacterota bacterium]